MLAVGNVYGTLIYNDNGEHTIDFVEDAVCAGNNTTLNIVEGAETHLCIGDNAIANIKGGIITAMGTYDTSTAFITGGDFRGNGDFYFRGDSTVHIKGGLFSSNIVLELYRPTIIFYGTDLTHTITAIGDINRYGVSGILENGDVLDDLGVYVGPEASIQFVPEPATVAMLALGGLLIRRRRGV